MKQISSRRTPKLPQCDKMLRRRQPKTPTQRTSGKYDNISTLKSAQIDEKYGANKACGSHDGAADQRRFIGHHACGSVLFVSQVSVDGAAICVTLVFVHFRFLLSNISRLFAGTRFCLSFNVKLDFPPNLFLIANRPSKGLSALFLASYRRMYSC